MGQLLSYREAVCEAMKMLGQDSRTIFIGQSVGYTGTLVYDTLKDVPMDKRLELPVTEEMQMGISIGLSLMGYIPVSIFPRFDFLLLAVNQLVNHLDRCEEMSHGAYKPKVIIRTVVGATVPLYPGSQHCQDYTEAFRAMLKNTEVVELNDPEDILPTYKEALHSPRSYLLVEKGNLYGVVEKK